MKQLPNWNYKMLFPTWLCVGEILVCPKCEWVPFGREICVSQTWQHNPRCKIGRRRRTWEKVISFWSSLPARLPACLLASMAPSLSLLSATATWADFPPKPYGAGLSDVAKKKYTDKEGRVRQRQSERERDIRYRARRKFFSLRE